MNSGDGFTRESDMARKENQRTTTGGSKRGQSAKSAGMHREPSGGEEILSPQGVSQARSGRGGGSGGTATATLSITHEQIAERARQIWEQHGRPQGEDERNWREAERQLKREFGVE